MSVRNLCRTQRGRPVVPDEVRQNRSEHILSVTGRLRAGVSVEQANVAMARIGRAEPETRREVRAFVPSGQEVLSGSLQAPTLASLLRFGADFPHRIGECREPARRARGRGESPSRSGSPWAPRVFGWFASRWRAACSWPPWAALLVWPWPWRSSGHWSPGRPRAPLGFPRLVSTSV